MEKLLDAVTSIHESYTNYYGKAIQRGLKDNWMSEVGEELRALEDNKVWRLKCH